MTTTLEKILLLDIPSTLEGSAWSPHTWRTRLALNYKGLEYITKWIEYPEIEPFCKEIGATPTSKRADGSDYYSLPVILDPNTSNIVVDSYAIAEYLDETYPDKPLLFPKNTQAATWLLRAELVSKFVWVIPNAIILHINDVLNTESEEYFRRTREELFDCTLEMLSLPSARVEREAHWHKAKLALDELAQFMDKNEPSDFFFGSTFSYADMMIAADLLWIKKVMDPVDWEFVSSWNGGRWERLVNYSEKYQAIL